VPDLGALPGLDAVGEIEELQRCLDALALAESPDAARLAVARYAGKPQ
jgi:hypothetical protein